MAKKERISVTLAGDKETIAALKELSSSIHGIHGAQAQQTALAKALRASGAILLREARSRAPRATGRFRRSMKQKIKKYKSTGVVVAIIGQDLGMAPKGKYRRGGGISGRGKVVPIHLVEQPTKPHTIPALDKQGRAKREYAFIAFGNRVVSRVNHPGTKGRFFMRAAMDAARDRAQQAFRAKLNEAVEIEAKKIAAKSDKAISKGVKT